MMTLYVITGQRLYKHPYIRGDQKSREPPIAFSHSLSLEVGPLNAARQPDGAL